jgi:hypothetical protein
MANNPSPRIAMGHAAREQAVRRWDRRLLARDFVAIAESAAESSSLVSLVAA